MDAKVTTVIVNQTKHGYTMKVGNRNCYTKLSSVKMDGGEYRMQLGMNWTYQEFVLVDNTDAKKKLFFNSDEFCDYEHITIKESSTGHVDVLRVERKHWGACSAVEQKVTTPKMWKFWLWL